MKIIKSKILNSIMIALVLILFAECNSQKKLNEEEMVIVSTFINEKLLVDLIYPEINDKFFQQIEKDSTKHYSLDEKHEIFKNLQEEVSQKKYYITISDTLFAVNNDYYLKGLTDAQNFRFINENFIEKRKINFKVMNVRKNLILVSSGKAIDKSRYLGSYEISRVIFGKDDRAFIGSKKILENGEYYREMTEFNKRGNKWVIKERWEN
ncbi:hypothetical protein P0M11_11145 [Kaistella sp. PBT33-4]|uniref:hypothetical protein n=1 Tax=Kaistella sp. PBT33-4 TaxID=3032000 RepID=UPI0023D8379D|nr:hypothetical protein [Kaistella sp. PBT33-4]MDF0720553.1 hypothetical protein [Kaistella sp. PBT33-4]